MCVCVCVCGYMCVCVCVCVCVLAGKKAFTQRECSEIQRVPAVQPGELSLTGRHYFSLLRFLSLILTFPSSFISNQIFNLKFKTDIVFNA